MIELDDKIKLLGEGYADGKMGPFEDLTSLKDIDYRFEGLAVTVLNPIPMECWLIGGKLNSNWRVKQFSSIPTYADLIEYTNTIFTSFKKMIAVGTEATVIEDENNDNKLTKYWVVSNNGTSIVWEKMNKLDGDYVPKDCVSGSDTE